MKPIHLLLLSALMFAACTPSRKAKRDQPVAVRFDTLTLTDAARNRPLPIAVWKPQHPQKHPRLIIFSHGYNQNRPGAYLGYSYLTEYFATQGYFVVSIQHELPTDSLMPLTGVPQVVRRPFWDRGADNILFVIRSLKQSHPQLDFRHVTLIGHSNGGDMTALFPQKYPGIVDKIITLDNRRVPLPRTAHPAVYSLRSSDQPADEGVLPTIAEQKQYNITIIRLPNTIHNDMDDDGTEAQRSEIRNYIRAFLGN